VTDIEEELDGMKTEILAAIAAVSVLVIALGVAVGLITAKLPTNYIMGSSVQTAKDDEIDAIKAIVDIIPAEITDVATGDDANSFTLTAGRAVADAYNGMIISVQDADDSLWESRMVYDWTALRVVTVDIPLGFTPAANDIVVIWNVSYFPGDVYDNMPDPPTSETILIDFSSSAGGAGGGGGTTTLNVEGDDP